MTSVDDAPMAGMTSDSPQGSAVFSVVIPVYNRPDHARACLAVFTGPDAVGVEVIVVDDGSTDDTAATVEAIAAQSQGARIRLIRQANAGPGPARNRGLSEATSDWVIFHDSDALPASRALFFSLDPPRHWQVLTPYMEHLLGPFSSPLCHWKFRTRSQPLALGRDPARLA
ncbi:MAG: glycosyltransferase family 2 protein [Paracoccaceae bacterium]